MPEEDQSDSYVTIVDMRMGHTAMFETKGRPFIVEEDDNGSAQVMSLYIKEVTDGRPVTVGVVASGSWNAIEVKKGTRGDLDG